MTDDRSPFRWPRPTDESLRSTLAGFGLFVLERWSGLTHLARLHEQIGPGIDSLAYVDEALGRLDVAVHVDEREIDRVPRHGPTIVVANHPFGMLDGLVLLRILLRVRPDVRVLANELLARIPALASTILPVDVLGREDGGRANRRALRAAIEFVAGGGLLAVFPSGEVAHAKLRRPGVHEGAWHSSIARIARRTKATVVPFYFEGRNGTMFQTAGLIHPRLRTLMLPRALWSRRGRAASVVVGNPIDASSHANFPDDRELAQYLRLRTLILGRRRRTASPDATAPNASTRPEPPIAPPAQPERIAHELSELPRDAQLGESGSVKVFLAAAEQIPETLGEIGRLREIAFRAAGEGTGRARDLDRFDSYYRHLFAYDGEQRRILGAYRIGATDEILPRLGAGGLYSSTLFRYEDEFLRWIDPGLELGRSFVVPDAQRSTRTLQLLWRGIGAFVRRHPRYRRLFGPVSISRDYADATRRILISHLATHHRHIDLERWVRPRRPPRMRAVRRLEREAGRLSDVRELSSVIRELEADARDVPVLVREYLKLGGRILAFNLDREFSNVIDGLVVVDLAEAPPARLRKYLGDAATDRFLAIHGVRPDAHLA